MGLFGGIGLGAVVLMVVWFVTRDAYDEAVAAPGATVQVEEPADPIADPTGWNGKLLQSAVAIHSAARNSNTEILRRLLDGRTFWYAAEILRAEGTGTSPRSEEVYAILPTGELTEVMVGMIASLKEGETGELIHEWEPYDGEVIELDGSSARVRLSLTPHAGGTERRFIDWKLNRDHRGDWRAYAWERWRSEKELAAIEEAAKPKGYEEVTLSDGTEVIERQPEPLGHLDTTPPDMRDRIDRLFATLIDLDLTRESAAAKRELVEIGKPVIPILLTGLYNTPIDTEEHRIQCNIMVVTLRSITAQFFGYAPQNRVGSGTGTSEEKRQSSIKQWFAWWYLNDRVFEKKQLEDMLKDHIQLTEKDKAWLEKHKD